jgi:hypothetical protein
VAHQSIHDGSAQGSKYPKVMHAHRVFEEDIYTGMTQFDVTVDGFLQVIVD